MLRIVTTLLLLLVSAAPGVAQTTFADYGLPIPNGTAQLRPQLKISEGQSWSTNYFTGMADHGFNPETDLLLTQCVQSGAFPSGVLKASYGIFAGTGILSQLCGFTSSMVAFNPNATNDPGNALTISRSSVLAKQLIRARAGMTPLAPIVEFNIGCPSSSWKQGPCGGLGNWPYIDNTGTPQPGLGTTSTPWANLLALLPITQASVPDQTKRLTGTPWGSCSISWVQGGSFDAPASGNLTPTITEWTQMVAANDALALPCNGPVRYYVFVRAPLTTDTVAYETMAEAMTFLRSPPNSRVFASYPMYPFPYSGADNIHTGDYGTIRGGEIEALVEHIVEDEGIQFTPLWQSKTNSIVISGQVITVPFDRPGGAEFASGTLSWRMDAQDGIITWPNYGFSVYDGATALTCPATIVGLTIKLTCTGLVSGHTVNVGYAWHGPGGTSPGVLSGVGGNLQMAGPASVLFPGTTINMWAFPIADVAVTVP